MPSSISSADDFRRCLYYPRHRPLLASLLPSLTHDDVLWLIILYIADIPPPLYRLLTPLPPISHHSSSHVNGGTSMKTTETNLIQSSDVAYYVDYRSPDGIWRPQLVVFLSNNQLSIRPSSSSTITFAYSPYESCVSFQQSLSPVGTFSSGAPLPVTPIIPRGRIIELTACGRLTTTSTSYRWLRVELYWDRLILFTRPTTITGINSIPTPNGDETMVLTVNVRDISKVERDRAGRSGSITSRRTAATATGSDDAHTSNPERGPHTLYITSLQGRLELSPLECWPPGSGHRNRLTVYTSSPRSSDGGTLDSPNGGGNNGGHGSRSGSPHAWLSAPSSPRSPGHSPHGSGAPSPTALSLGGRRSRPASPANAIGNRGSMTLTSSISPRARSSSPGRALVPTPPIGSPNSPHSHSNDATTPTKSTTTSLAYSNTTPRGLTSTAAAAARASGGDFATPLRLTTVVAPMEQLARELHKLVAGASSLSQSSSLSLSLSSGSNSIASTPVNRRGSVIAARRVVPTSSSSLAIVSPSSPSALVYGGPSDAELESRTADFFNQATATGEDFSISALASAPVDDQPRSPQAAGTPFFERQPKGPSSRHEVANWGVPFPPPSHAQAAAAVAAAMNGSIQHANDYGMPWRWDNDHHPSTVHQSHHDFTHSPFPSVNLPPSPADRQAALASAMGMNDSDCASPSSVFVNGNNSSTNLPPSPAYRHTSAGGSGNNTPTSSSSMQSLTHQQSTHIHQASSHARAALMTTPASSLFQVGSATSFRPPRLMTSPSAQSLASYNSSDSPTSLQLPSSTNGGGTPALALPVVTPRHVSASVWATTQQLTPTNNNNNGVGALTTRNRAPSALPSPSSAGTTSRRGSLSARGSMTGTLVNNVTTSSPIHGLPSAATLSAGAIAIDRRPTVTPTTMARTGTGGAGAGTTTLTASSNGSSSSSSGGGGRPRSSSSGSSSIPPISAQQSNNAAVSLPQRGLARSISTAAACDIDSMMSLGQGARYVPSIVPNPQLAAAATTAAIMGISGTNVMGRHHDQDLIEFMDGAKPTPLPPLPQSVTARRTILAVPLARKSMTSRQPSSTH
jgi:hypothetical protein